MSAAAVQIGLFPGFDEPAGGVIRGYVPEIYCDEVPPPLRETPDAWLIAAPNGVPALAGCVASEMMPIVDGEIVYFARLTDFGTTVLDIDEGGEWRVGRDMPSGAQVCADNDPDSISDSIEMLIEGLAPEPGHSYHFDLHYYDWSDGISYRFDAAGRRFMLVEGA